MIDSPVERRLAQLEAVAGTDRVVEYLDLAIEAAKSALTIADLNPPMRIDLNDPATENLVADAIRRLAPEGAYVPLHVRYPWRFAEQTEGGTSATLVDAVVAALRSSAEVHEAERLPHLVPALLALAEALEHGALVPGPPPGRCGTQAPGLRAVSCDLRAGHAGQHEGADWEAMRNFEGLALPSTVHWTAEP